MSWWYPGYGEEAIINRLHPELRGFLADAVADDPSFLYEYLLPTLGSVDPESRMLSDLADVLTALEFEEVGLGDLAGEQLGDLGSLKKKLKKSVKRVGKAVKRVAKSSVGQAVLAPLTMGLSVKGVREGIKKGLRSKYAAPVIGVTGAVFAPFTGGASLAASAALLASNQMYQAKKAAEAAKRASKKDAAQKAAVARQAESQTSAQVDQFYAQNAAWFAAHGIDQTKWNSMTLNQKIATIDAAAKGQLPVVQQPGAGASMPQMPQELPEGGGAAPGAYQGAGSAPTAGGGSGGGGGGLAPQETGSPKTAQAGMFGGPLPLIMAAGALIYLLFGRKGHGRGRRTRRNPRGSSRWIVAA